jgi:DNA-binding MarR family transcriptional regulator
VLAEEALPLLRAFTLLAERSLEDAAPGLTLQQFRAVTVLHESGPLQATALAGALGIAPSTLTRLADRLVRTGLVSRGSDDADRRAVVLSVTRRGAHTARRVRARREQALARRFDGLAPDERAVVLDALRTAAPIFDAAGGRR